MCTAHNNMLKNKKLSTIEFTLLHCIFCIESSVLVVAKSFTSLDNNVSICYVYLDYDECTSGPCLNGGTCKNGKRKFSCICPRTHKGRICEGRRAS